MAIITVSHNNTHQDRNMNENMNEKHENCHNTEELICTVPLLCRRSNISMRNLPYGLSISQHSTQLYLFSALDRKL